MSRVAELNDALRRDSSQGHWIFTQGVLALPLPAVDLCRAISEFNSFTPENDPYGKRDFGAFELAGHRLFWKIDYFDKRLEQHSPDPADPMVTARVLTVMLASEY